jgi:hypothetical protein
VASAAAALGALVCLLILPAPPAWAVLGNDLLTTTEQLPDTACGGSSRCIMTPLQAGSASPTIKAIRGGVITAYQLRHGSFSGATSVELAVVHPTEKAGEFTTVKVGGSRELQKASEPGGTETFTLKESEWLPIGEGDQVALIAPFSLKVLWSKGEARAGSHLGSIFNELETFSYPFAGGELFFNASEKEDPFPPSILIIAPANEGRYAQGQVVDASYECTEESGTKPAASCVGTVENRQPFDTSTVGTHAFTVTATDKAGESTERTVTYQVNPGPAVTKLKPTKGPVSGGTKVTIVGTNLSGASAVKFGALDARSFEVISASEIKAVTPAEAAGTVYVTVTTPGGSSAPSSASRFKFHPTISKVVPNEGPHTGGTSVTVTGKGFLKGATTIKFGSAKAISVNCSTWESLNPSVETTCTVTSPEHEVGPVDVKATVNKVSSPNTSADVYTYN